MFDTNLNNCSADHIIIFSQEKFKIENLMLMVMIDF